MRPLLPLLLLAAVAAGAAEPAASRVQSLTLSAGADEPQLAADWYRPATPSARLIVVAPGFAQHKGTRSMQFVASRLLPQADVLLLDLRGTGQSHGFFHFGQEEYRDVRAALDWGQARYGRVDLLGFSLGAYSCLRAAAQSGRPPEACLLVSLPNRVETIIASGGIFTFPLFGLGLGERTAVRPEADPFFRWGAVLGPKPEAVALAPGLRCPVHLLVGAKDELVYPAQSRRVWEALPSPATYSRWADGRHAEQMALRHPRAFTDWVGRCLAWRGGKQDEPFTIALDEP